MKQQKSFLNDEGSGLLYLVPTPIGNLEDMTYRAVRILKEVDLIAAEDTRQTKKLCHYFEITTPLVSYHEHNRKEAGTKLINEMKSGKKVALVSDAGMPAISDPGQELVRESITEHISVIPLPGANAALMSLVGSGLSTDSFQFVGFLPRHEKRKKEELEKLIHQEATLLFYESPHRLKATLTTMRNVFGNRPISVCRELTKKFEEYIRGTLDEVLEWTVTGQVKGEFCIVVEGFRGEAEANDWWESFTINEHVDHYMAAGLTSKDAIKKVALERKQPKREIYASYHQN
ncbi:16S rRNA (cytidine(1402)-2'-O)-methyltransferase [Halalkalibacter hemicellulosilyticus]|uniref:Ribosomal RNA small subunit methyltransferase I n=1 Tax=Halalkalibacter hemicellulosilyticusJCM 9152 TaxID=1236971 RepID=W4QHZ6_9BACI|nr:16S rRNA (cytidine(1402)-2'-O)-methyltransferase [Halalkalibacter hemicellulosilyticus]GAE31726.1 rRNA small subunit methyltransferase I [Halalkalibacter hemicellulosilyticusJCM 9152]